ncbi:hypothetical protein C1646_749803 [Rhizophagus diaphanus]|nr:hypothetical protein C1646_749803 [Rhizophagus diaphanus] [Rhizophagus sp. MUCL 43196]
MRPILTSSLKNESTFEPLKIIQGIIEDANKYKKELGSFLWFNEYNNVRKSMKRMSLPESFINLVMDINLNIFNRVIVNNSMTEEYYVQDRIDQGEVWSQILWRNFYDALLARLEEVKEVVAYEIKEERDLEKRKKIYRFLLM